MGRFVVGIIGCGNMGSAIAQGLIDKGVIAPGSILLTDKDEEKAVLLSGKTGCPVRDLVSLLRHSDYLVISVKPQDFAELSGMISADISGQTVISVMAGVRISTVMDRLGPGIAVARAMPNMAALVSESITCVTYNGLVRAKDEVRDILSGIGAVMEIEEDLMDAVTAVSGSGPAYLFYLADAMITAGVKAGLTEEQARRLVTRTLYGSAVLMDKTLDPPRELIKMVASRGGTTEAALSVLEKNSVRAAIIEAVTRAKERSREMSGG
ncbi:MAG: pyrroline-5-carboxylate reductase [Candidatus Omnitrophota bacterium]